MEIALLPTLNKMASAVQESYRVLARSPLITTSLLPPLLLSLAHQSTTTLNRHPTLSFSWSQQVSFLEPLHFLLKATVTPCVPPLRSFFSHITRSFQKCTRLYESQGPRAATSSPTPQADLHLPISLLPTMEHCHVLSQKRFHERSLFESLP